MRTVRVNTKGADRIASGHPWIFASDVVDRGNADAGDTVVITASGRGSLGVAHYSSTSQICLRLLSNRVETVDRAFFARRIRAAASFRTRVVESTDAHRLVHAEADLLPGLIIDRYGEYFSIQTLDQGMDRSKAEIVACIQEQFAPKGIVERNEAPVRKYEDLPLQTGVICGEIPKHIVLNVNGLELIADLVHGQKTGIFLDQRENYTAVANYAHGRALDCFTSTGGFALHMAGKCTSIEGIDSSAEVLKIAQENRDRNSIQNVEFRQGDVFDLLASYVSARRSFDTIVLDPPAFTKSRSTVQSALRGYKEINRRALQLLGPGGILVSCSCSQHVSDAQLFELVAEASLDTGRKLRVLERRTQSRDHPILLTVPETLYLKCHILEVMEG